MLGGDGADVLLGGDGADGRLAPAAGVMDDRPVLDRAQQARAEPDAPRRSATTASAPPVAVTSVAMIMRMQQSAGNFAVTRVLARDLPKPDDQPAHLHAFDTFVSGMFAKSDPASLQAAREACDKGPLSDLATLSYAGNQLMVDQRNLTAVLTRIRWRAMDRIHEIAQQHNGEEQSGSDEAGREKARVALLNDARPYLDFLKGKIQDPKSAQDRFAHWYDAVQSSVRQVLQLQVVEEARKAGLKEDGTGKTRGEMEPEVGRMKGEAWCGAFAGYAYRQAGLGDGEKGAAAKVGQLDGEGGILTFMAYQDDRSKKKIRDGEQTPTVKAYHASRGSMRRIRVVANADGKASFTTPGGEIVTREELKVSPGDILLLDNHAGFRPDHIQIATSSDTGAMSHIAGNEVDKPGRVAGGGATDIRHQPDSITPAQHAVYDRKAALKAKEADKKKTFTDEDKAALAAVNAEIEAFEKAHPKRSRIAAVCTFSIVDFEIHDYV